MLLSSRPLTRNILGCGLMLAALAGCDRQSGPAAQPSAAASAEGGAPGAEGATPGIDTSHKGSRLPDLTFKDPQGGEIRTATLAGKPLLINLWATWCGPCVAELPTLDALAQQRGGALTVLAISEDSAPAATVAAFLKAHSASHLVAALDPDTAASSQWQAQSLPTTIYYGADGREVWRSTGGMDWTGPAATALLARAAS